MSIEQLAEFLNTRDWLNKKIRTICNKHGYSASIRDWNIEGDKLVIYFVEGGQFYLATYFTRNFPLSELLGE